MDLLKRFSKALDYLEDYPGVIDGPTRYNLLYTLRPGLEAEEGKTVQETVKNFAEKCKKRGASGRMACRALAGFHNHRGVNDGLHAASENTLLTFRSDLLKAVPKKSGIRFALLAVAEAMRNGDDVEQAAWDHVKKYDYKDNGSHCFAVLVSGFLSKGTVDA
jgi:hypothetical protein